MNPREIKYSFSLFCVVANLQMVKLVSCRAVFNDSRFPTEFSDCCLLSNICLFKPESVPCEWWWPTSRRQICQCRLWGWWCLNKFKTFSLLVQFVFFGSYTSLTCVGVPLYAYRSMLQACMHSFLTGYIKQWKVWILKACFWLVFTPWVTILIACVNTS